MNLVAITACPTGIAHSQMAAENIQTTAEKRGHEIHVEVQGAMGTENEIPDDVLSAADAVIIAADTSVQQDRFGDHVVVKSGVKDGVNDAGGLINEAVERADSEMDDNSELTTDSNDTTDARPESDPESTRPDSPDSGGVLIRLKQLFF
jgi:PTS system fructose-specific IIB component